MTNLLLVTIIAIALFFVFINGFHDTANVVATTIATRALSPYQAIIIAAIFNFIGAFFGTGVAVTISKGLLDASLVTHTVLLASLLAAIIWNLLTWLFGIPSSSSHALIGALAGAGIAAAGTHAVNYHTMVDKVIIRELQVLSTSLLSFSHGSNDAQKNMSIIVMALFSFKLVPNVTDIPIWVTVVCGLALALGTVSGGMKIIKTLSTRVAKLRPVNGFAAELSSGLLIIGASHMGLPVSTTQAVSGSIMGAGYMGSGGVNWRVVRQMVIAWSLTLPCCILFGAVIFKLLQPILG